MISQEIMIIANHHPHKYIPLAIQIERAIKKFRHWTVNVAPSLTINFSVSVRLLVDSYKKNIMNKEVNPKAT